MTDFWTRPPEMTEPPATMESRATPHALGVGKDKFGRGILVLPGAKRPIVVVKIKDRRHADEIHIRLVVGIEGSDVAPVERVLGVFIDKVVSENAVLRNDAWKNVLTEIVGGLGVLGIGKKDRNEQLAC